MYPTSHTVTDDVDDEVVTPSTPASPTQHAISTLRSDRVLQVSANFADVAPPRWLSMPARSTANGDEEAADLDHPQVTFTQAQHRHHDGVPIVDVSHGINDVETDAQSELIERGLWQARDSIELGTHEREIFRYYVTESSRWIDPFDPLQHFSNLVPHLALRNEGLMNAILALGAQQRSLKSLAVDGSDNGPTLALQYFDEALRYLQTAMRYKSYKNSQELLATVLIISCFEMIDGAGQGWERHLKAVFWVMKERNINESSGGLEQATYEAWVRQDLWAAFRERRRCFGTYTQTIDFRTTSTLEMASQVVYLLAQAVNYASDEEKQAGDRDLAERILRANSLLETLKAWRGRTA